MNTGASLCEKDSKKTLYETRVVGGIGVRTLFARLKDYRTFSGTETVPTTTLKLVYKSYWLSFLNQAHLFNIGKPQPREKGFTIRSSYY